MDTPEAAGATASGFGHFSKQRVVGLLGASEWAKLGASRAAVPGQGGAAYGNEGDLSYRADRTPQVERRVATQQCPGAARADRRNRILLRDQCTDFGGPTMELRSAFRLRDVSTSPGALSWPISGRCEAAWSGSDAASVSTHTVKMSCGPEVLMADDSPSIRLVRRYIEAVQRARASGDVEDFEALREFLAADVVIKVASPWTDEPWQVLHRGADAVITRMQAPINKATSLTTENVTVQQAGDDVYVEQLSTLIDDNGTHVSMVCHIFSVVDGLITGVRAYRNERGSPAFR